jgi:hypothetical protein
MQLLGYYKIHKNCLTAPDPLNMLLCAVMCCYVLLCAGGALGATEI